MGWFSRDYVTTPCIEWCEAPLGNRHHHSTASRPDSAAARQARMSSTVDRVLLKLPDGTVIRSSTPPSPSDNDASKSSGSSGVTAAKRASARSLDPVQTISASAFPMLRRPITTEKFQYSQRSYRIAGSLKLPRTCFQNPDHHLRRMIEPQS